VTCGSPSERGIVPTSDEFAPAPTAGLPLSRTGGHAVAQAPLHTLRF
jgi:hypothetical protein